MADTVLRGICGLDTFNFPPGLHSGPITRRIFGHGYQSLSYILDWQEAFLASPELDADLCMISNLFELRKALRDIAAYSLIIILHGATGDSVSLLRHTAHWFDRRKGKLMVFVGNEYQLMSEKIELLRQLQAEYVCSQLPLDAAKWVYSECSGSQVLPAPHALNPQLYKEDCAIQRNIDIGFRGARYPFFIGDNERNSIIKFFTNHGQGHGLLCDIALASLSRKEWSRFLCRCKGVIGVESGTYYLAKDDHLIREVNQYLADYSSATFEEIFDRFFLGRSQQVSGKAISSRHFDPIGTHTCQLLLEGEYNGILKPEEHYICVKKDLSDINEAIRRFKDVDYRQAIVKRSYEYVMSAHTYSHRVESILGHCLAP